MSTISGLLKGVQQLQALLCMALVQLQILVGRNHDARSGVGVVDERLQKLVIGPRRGVLQKARLGRQILRRTHSASSPVPMSCGIIADGAVGGVAPAGTGDGGTIDEVGVGDAPPRSSAAA